MRYETVKEIPLEDLAKEIIDREGLDGISNVAETLYNYILVKGADYLFSPKTSLHKVKEFDTLDMEVFGIIYNAPDWISKKSNISNVETVISNLLKLLLAVRLFNNEEIPNATKSELTEYNICHPIALSDWRSAFPYSRASEAEDAGYNIETSRVNEIQYAIDELFTDFETDVLVRRWAHKQWNDFETANKSLQEEITHNLEFKDTLLF